MPSRHFTQSAVILFESLPSVLALERALESFEIVRRVEVEKKPAWMGGYPGVLLAMRPDVNGYVLVDIVDAEWPDSMGDPRDQAELFGAWALGWFGPFVFPGGLEMARRIRPAEPEKTKLIDRHRAFVRIKSSYVLGGGENAALLPPDYDPVAELRFLTSVAQALLSQDGALLYFNPNGQTLHSVSSLKESLAYHASQKLMPLDVWSSVRFLAVEGAADWRLMDTVGMDQLGVSDHEACIPPNWPDLSQVEHFLRNSVEYVFRKGPVVRDGDTMNGPGDMPWRAQSFEESLASPPREVLRWRPANAVECPAIFGFPKR